MKKRQMENEEMYRWQERKMKGWNNGNMAGWRNGKVKRWRDGRMDMCKVRGRVGNGMGNGGQCDGEEGR